MQFHSIFLLERLSPQSGESRAWWVAGHRSTEPSHTLVLDQLDLEPLLELKMRLGEGSGATAALPLVVMAGRILSDMATFADAGISGPGDAPTAADPAADAEHASAAPEAGAETASAEPEPGAGLELDATPVDD